MYLCLDGSKLPLDAAPCEWAHKPTNVFVTAPITTPGTSTSGIMGTNSNNNRQEVKEFYLTVLQQLFYRFVPYKPSWWRMRSLFSDSNHVTQILPVPKHLQLWDKYLGNYISSIEKPLPGCEPNSVSFCTSSQLEEMKCLDLQKAAFSQRIRPEIDCKRRSTKLDCLEMVSRRQADLVAVDLNHLYETQQVIIQQLEPVAINQVSEQDYSVALVRADSGIKFLYQLGGRRSCHASFGDTASWLAPISVLTERSLLDQEACNKADQMADYFGQSCVPGAADLRINLYRSGSEKLCALCRGEPQTGNHQCERSKSERYYGQTGALRCLVEGAGEVAFMSLNALAANVDGRSLEQWARAAPLALDSRNFRLICRSGPNMLLGDYERCHLARLPGKIIVSTKFTSKEDRLTTRRLLIWLEEKFLMESREMFDLFGPYQNESDLLFDDLTKKLTPIQLEMSNFDLVGKQHFDPSFQQLPISHRDSACKLVLKSSANSLTTTTTTTKGLLILSAIISIFLLSKTIQIQSKD